MEETKPNNPPAFPVAMSPQTIYNQNYEPYQEGMTLRDYFAAKAMPVIVEKTWLRYVPIIKRLKCIWTKGKLSGDTQHWTDHNAIAKSAYEMADAMLKERSK
jgi:hypothetical protein